MRAMLLDAPRRPLREAEIERPDPGRGQVLIRVRACAVCRTDLHIADGELPDPKLPLILGHEIAGTIDALGPEVSRFRAGDRVGVPWLGWTCGRCEYCANGRENLCGEARFTGYQIDGGYAAHTVADARFVFPIPDGYDELHAAPLLCAGLIGYRSLAACGDAEKIGIYGFGAAAHLIAQVIRHRGRRLFAFTRPGDTAAQVFAGELGAEWAGDSDRAPPELLDAAIILAPVGALIPIALRAVRRGGTVVCGGIHMSDIPSFPYRDLWGERTIRSVANLTRADGETFLPLAAEIPIETHVQEYALEDANRALSDLRAGRVEGAAVLAIG